MHRVWGGWDAHRIRPHALPEAETVTDRQREPEPEPEPEPMQSAPANNPEHPPRSHLVEPLSAHVIDLPSLSTSLKTPPILTNNPNLSPDAKRIPTNPIVLTNPTVPTNPTNLTILTNPINLITLSNPTNPISPTNPTNPTILTNPTYPTNLTIPNSPTYLTDPTIPNNPAYLNNPTNPYNPTYLTNPTSPTNSTILTNQTNLTILSNPSNPTNPINLTIPSSLTNPTIPANPTYPTNPTNLTDPTNPTIPTIPTISTNLSNLTILTNPDASLDDVEAGPKCGQASGSEGRVQFEAPDKSSVARSMSTFSLDSLTEHCRICQQSTDEYLTELGCHCRGELAKAHRSCIQQWFNSKGSNKCEVCQHVATNIPPPEAPPLRNFWAWRTSGQSGIAFTRRQTRAQFHPLWAALLIIAAGLLFDVLISVFLGGSTLPINIIIGILVVLGIGTGLRLIIECLQERLRRRRRWQMEQLEANALTISR